MIGASDLHISAGCAPFVRLHGRIRRMDLPPHTEEEAKELLLPFMREKDRKIFVDTNDFDFALELDGLGRFRTNYFRTRKGYSGVFRLIPDKVPTLEELGLPSLLAQFTKIQVGIVLITGPAGCGKSSTMAALVEIINQTRKDHIITVEDPIEFNFESKKSNVTQRQVQVHTESWGVALRAGLREDPDVIMVGEMRDLDTIATAVTAAETGHLVLGTLHTTNATRTVDRIIDIFPPKQQEQIRAMVSESIRGVICQQLVPRADGKGRVPALEILVANTAVGNLIREKKTFQLISVLQTGKNLGMIQMDDSLEALLKDGVITRDEAIFRAQDPKRFKSMAR
ncbi:MAG: type IV pilus twitching motility protein PilT [Planctomycetota bacterium]|nr:type IV pilus twitching motility protein PilT [Planctomycetota bacterium]